MFDVTQLGFEFALVLGAVFLVCIFYWFLRGFFLGSCSRCGQARSPSGKYCVKCGTRYE